jgi:hypothetical protein
MTCHCGQVFRPKRPEQRHCAPRCAIRYATERSGLARTNRAKERVKLRAEELFGALTGREAEIARWAWNEGKSRGYSLGWHRAKRAA